MFLVYAVADVSLHSNADLHYLHPGFLDRDDKRELHSLD